jgi:hypothetical protein
MRKLLTITAAVFAALAVAGGEFTLQEAAGIHIKFEKVALAGDYPAMAKLVNQYMSPKFVYVEGPKTSSRDQWLSEIEFSMKSGNKVQTFKFKLGQPSSKGGKVMLPATLTITAKGKGQDGKNHIYGTEETLVETWAKLGGKWVVEKIESKSMKMSVDGKPLNPNTRPRIGTGGAG